MPHRMIFLSVAACLLFSPTTVGLAAPPIDVERNNSVSIADATPAEDRPAFDTDHIWTETPAGKPVIDRGPAGAWDHYAVDNPTVFTEGETYYCFFEAQDKPFNKDGHERMGLATSRDGISWTKFPDNPILDVGPAGAWDSVVAKLPTVTKSNGRYYLFYSGRDGRTKQIGVASSTDLKHWSKHPANPVLRSRPNRWDALLSTHPAPIFARDGSYYLLFRGMNDRFRKQSLGVAVSTDLIHWKRVKDKPVIGPKEETGSLAVVETETGYIGLSQASGRPYWHSKDLVAWKKVGAARFTGPKVDTVSNPFHTGEGWTILYEQQDRIYRAVLSRE